MRFSVKSHYALLAMIDVAEQDQKRPVRLTEIAERQQLPLPYLEQLFNCLKRKGLVTSVRGQHGGYHLAHAPDALPLSSILSAVEEPIHVTQCGRGNDENDKGCRGGHSRCGLHHLWEDLEHHINTYLSERTLADLCGFDKPQEKGG